jgi:transposase
MKAYSTDLRQKIIETYESERISQRQLAQRFRVAPSFIIKLLKQYRETGDLAPKSRPGRPRGLNEAQMETVQALVEANPDWTLDELRAAVAQTCGVTVSQATMCRVMKRLQFTRKKKPFTPVTR